MAVCSCVIVRIRRSTSLAAVTVMKFMEYRMYLCAFLGSHMQAVMEEGVVSIHVCVCVRACVHACVRDVLGNDMYGQVIQV